VENSSIPCPAQAALSRPIVLPLDKTAKPFFKTWETGGRGIDVRASTIEFSQLAIKIKIIYL
jgi:hypothetical protein